MFNWSKYFWRGDIPIPWKTRDAVIDEILGLTAHHIDAINILISLVRGLFWISGHGIPTTRRPDKLSDIQISWPMRSVLAYISSQLIYYSSNPRRFQVLTWNMLFQARLTQRRTILCRRLPPIQPTSVHRLGWPWARVPRQGQQRMPWIIYLLGKGLFVDGTTYIVQKHASFFQRDQFNLCR